jgi:hypothetical protein
MIFLLDQARILRACTNFVLPFIVGHGKQYSSPSPAPLEASPPRRICQRLHLAEHSSVVNRAEPSRHIH